MKNNYCDYFKNKKITLMGLGVLGRGVGVAKFLAECGAKLTITDLKTKKELRPSLKKLQKFKNIIYVLGKHSLSDFKDKDMIIKAAGVPFVSPYIKEARGNKVPVEMDASLFAKLSGARIIGVTGTRGKSTTTHLVYNVLKKSGKRVFLGGNIKGLATLPLLKVVRSGDIVVMELDSWQLQGFGDAKISPHIAVFTNLMNDHMNYYKNNMKRYFKDKANIFQYQNKDDFLITGKKAQKVVKKFFKRKIKSKIIIATLKNIPKNWKVKIPGKHNLENISVAVAALEALGIAKRDIKKSIESFSGLEGRLEFIRESGGVKYYNDTTATTPEGVIAGLEAMKKYRGRIVLIGGGADKMLDYKNYAKIVKKYVKVLVLFKGAATDKIILALSKTKFPVEVVDNMNDALKYARTCSGKGDIILLSPGAASFGVFKNEFDRGEQFNKLVKRI